MGLNFYFYRLLILPMLFAGPLCFAGQQLSHRSTADSDHRPGDRKVMAGIKDFGEITPFLYRGSVPNDEALRALAESGVQIIVDTRAMWTSHERKEARRLGMQYVKISWHCPFPKEKTMARFLKLIRDNPHKKIFVHCLLGDDRSGMLIAAYRMADQGWTSAEALGEMEKFGFTKSHRVICPGLARYESHFPHRFQTAKSFKDLR